MNLQLMIFHDGKPEIPVIQEGIQWETQRSGVPGKLTFKILKDEDLEIDYGDAVRLQDGNDKVFFGFIFKIDRTKDKTVPITAYDQLRYLKNKDTLQYKNKTYAQLLQMIAEDQHLQCGTLDDTGYVIPTRLEENTSYFDMLGNASDLTLTNTGKMYILYDDFGALTLRELSSMAVVDEDGQYLVFDETSAEDYDYQGSIDSQTYDKVKLTYDNEETGVREVYIAQGGSNINKWGVLQYYDKLSKGEDGQTKADALLKLYNAPTRTLELKNAWGDNRVRAGSLVIVRMQLDDLTLQNFMLVEKCTHKWDLDVHTMTMKLKGGEING